jgi:polysaccharide export outer membrane protein
MSIAKALRSVIRLSPAAVVAVFIAVAGFSTPAFAASTIGGDYRIRPGDVLELTVFGEPTLSQSALTVLPGGGVVTPLAGQVRVGGLTPPQAGDAIAHALSKYLRHPKVALAVSLVSPLDIYVLGNVKLPGKYQLQPQSTLMDALAAAGGLGPVDGDYPTARLSVGDDVREVSLRDLLQKGDLSGNAPLANQMTVYVASPITFNVQVFGAVDKPGDVVMHQGDRLVMAIARAGNSPNSNSDLNRVVVRHNVGDGKATTQTINMYDVYKNGDISNDLVMQKGDYVYVPEGRGKHDTVSSLSGILGGLGRLFGIYR